MKIKQQQQQQLNYLTNTSTSTNNNNTSNSNANSSGLTLFSSSNSTCANAMTSNQTTNDLTTSSSSLLANSNITQPLTTIWTRSAAFKAAQQETTPCLNENLLASNFTIKRNHNHHHFGTHHNASHSSHHGHYQHVLGKIVKPIPVRPLSSSSSSSSTHSSLFNSSNSNSNHLAGVLKSINQTTSSNLDSITLATPNLNATDIEIDSVNSSNNSAGNFSLIAKYFASFPATRLKSTSSSSACTANTPSTTTNMTSLHDQSNIHHNVNCPHHQHQNSQSPILKSSNDLFATRNHETPTPTSALPQTRHRTNTFMPFKKSSNQTKQSTTSPASNLNELNTTTDKIQSTFILRSQSAFNNKVQQTSNSITTSYAANNINATTTNNNITINNTDHLCTNFKRMIKLSDNHFNHTIESDPASPLTAASNTPTFDSSNLGGDLPSSFDQTLVNSTTNTTSANNTFTFPNFDSETNFILPLNNQIDNSMFNSLSSSIFSASTGNATSSSNDQSTRFGQITMETRSTRKFLIKHHPYLQLNSNINNNSTNTNKLFNQQRPSINLIKMKKLCSKSFNNNINLKLNDQTLVDSLPNHSNVTRSSGRNSRSNMIDKDEDSKLLKFTDTAPQIANLNQSSYSLRVKNSTTNLKTTNTSTPTTKSNKKSSKSKTTSNSSNTNQTKTEEWCCCFNSDNCNDTSNEYVVNNCFEEYDDQEEDSSGYYSSYQSVDLVSTSGGGSIIGDKQETKSNDLKSNQQQPQQQIQQSTQNQQQQQVPVPQHHYHTRYLTNFLQQTTNSSSTMSPNNRTITATPKNSNTNTTPTTRLRYQQQLAAAAAASKTSPTNIKHYYTSHANNSRFHEQYQLECDLDLDQIEND